MVTYPSDWKTNKIIEVADIFDNLRIPVTKNQRKPGNTPYYGANGIQDYVSGYTHDGEFVLIAEDGANDLQNYPVTYASGKIWVNNHAHVLAGVNSKADTRFLAYLLKKVDFAAVLVGGTRAKLNGKTLKNIEVTLPERLKEQQAIASALSDFDEHIDNLTELIEKKKAIRDGALEDLVSGRTRLDGFNGEWISVKLSDFAQINPSSALPEVFKYVDLESVKGITLMGWRVERKETAPSRAKRLAQFGDIFFQTVRPYQRNNYLFELSDEDVVFSTGYAQLRTKNDARFLFLLLRQDDFVNEVLDNCTGTSYPAINPSKLSDIKIYVPIDKNEQQAIAEVLTAMDEEIESLKIEKEKMIQIKEGAMDDLLTGRVRLKV
ncbi:restriction endonuclease subunit S [Listeria innocua]|jgi:type I restriction enzyme S subunit|uniref:restriction endonuclease subunit S n=1 Tax=Listeria innocua TaxID=1642 RepID=UPI002453CAEA|nr:restriction endonuclease subunit S [Listeria innocua]MDH4615074.1 restriction endonuclease subunit S [Listeria innocua]